MRQLQRFANGARWDVKYGPRTPAPALTTRRSLSSYFSREVVPFPLSLFSLFLFLRRWASAPAAVLALLGGSFDASHVPSFADLCRGRWGGGVGGSSLVPRDTTENTKEKEKKVLLPVEG